MWIKTKTRGYSPKTKWVNTEKLVEIGVTSDVACWFVRGHTMSGICVDLGYYQTKEQAEQALEKLFNGMKANLHFMTEI